VKILCIGTHPDDLCIGMGGTISKFKKRGYDIIPFISRECNGMRYLEEKNALECLKIKHFLIKNFTFEDVNQMEEIGYLDKLIKETKPNRVYIPSKDSNQHHRRLNEMCISALRRTNIDIYSYCPTTVKGIEIYPFVPNLYEDISKEFKCKIKAIRCHKTQLKKFGNGYIDFIKDKDAHNGFQIGVNYAETFQMIREVKK